MGRLTSSRLLNQVLLTVAGTLAATAAVPSVHAYLVADRAEAKAPRQEQRIPDGLRAIRIRAGASSDVLQRVEVERGKSVVLLADYDVERVAVGDPVVAGVVVADSRTIQVVPQNTGDTNVLVWDAAGRLQTALDLHVGAGQQSQALTELRRVLEHEQITVDMAGEALVLRGSVSSNEARDRAEQVARAFFAGADSDPTRPDARIVNLIDVAGNQQVMLSVTMAEMDRQIGRELTHNFQTLIRDGAKAYAFGSGLGGLAALEGGKLGNDLVGGSGSLFGGVLDPDGTSVQSFLRIARSKGLVKILAEPTLVARSGEKANFLAGGEVPILVPQAFGQVTIEYKNFGVGVEFVPTVMGDRIHLQVTPEVSEPDPSLGIVIAGTAVPAFTTRRVSTSIELRDGQSYAVAGLLQDKVKTLMEKVPGLGDLPILGALFSSQRFQKNETELVMIVTPHFVKPLPAGRRPLPTDHYQDPDDLDFFALGRDESRRVHPHAAAASVETAGEKETE